MPPLRIGIMGAQFAAHLHLNNYKPLRGAKVEILAVAARAGKHVICEKPLTGYFGTGRPEELVGLSVDRGTMFREAMANCEAVAGAIRENKVAFCYAENWVYAPPVAKLKNLMKVSMGTVMDIRGEESHSGSHAAYSRKWKCAGEAPF
jgi:predicted dehydrogenase